MSACGSISCSEDLIFACQSAEHSLVAYGTGEAMAFIVAGCPQPATVTIGPLQHKLVEAILLLAKYRPERERATRAVHEA